MDQSNPWDGQNNINSNYMVCPVCGFWYDKTTRHICLNEPVERERTLKDILQVLKNIQNLLERRLS